MSKQARTITLYVLTTILVALTVAVFYGVVTRERPSERDRKAASAVVHAPVAGEETDKVGQMFPSMSLTDMAEITKTIELPMRGQGFVLVNLFASWCKPCLAEWPHLQSLANVEGLKLLGVGLADDQGMEAFLERNGNPFDQIGLDIKGEVLTTLRAPGLPVTYVLDSQGLVRFYRAGPLLDDDIAAIKGIIQ